VHMCEILSVQNTHARAGGEVSSVEREERLVLVQVGGGVKLKRDDGRTQHAMRVNFLPS